MNYFKFCPNCSSQNCQFENNRRFECFDCGMVYYQNVAAAVAVIIEHDDKILFTVRNREPKLGMLDLPGGFTDPDESAEETCTRELREELNLEIIPENFKYFKSQPNNYVYKGIPYKTEDLIFTANLPATNKIILETSEIQEIKWISKNEINIEDIGFESLQNAIKSYLNVKLE